jgi:hypothetical protein
VSECKCDNGYIEVDDFFYRCYKCYTQETREDHDAR